MITNDVSAFHRQFFMFIQYFRLNFSAVWTLIIFNSFKVTDVLVWPPNDFHVMKNVFADNLPLCNNKAELMLKILGNSV